MRKKLKRKKRRTTRIDEPLVGTPYHARFAFVVQQKRQLQLLRRRLECVPASYGEEGIMVLALLATTTELQHLMWGT